MIRVSNSHCRRSRAAGLRRRVSTWGEFHDQADTQARMARDSHGLPKVSPRPAMPDRSKPWGRVTPETALQLFLAWPAHRIGDLRQSSTPLDTPRHTSLLGKHLKNNLTNY
jgi:hypothetical protein